MKNLIGIGVVLLCFVALVLFAFPSVFASDRPTCGDGVCIKTQVGEPVRANEPMTVSVNVITERDIPNLGISLSASSGDAIPETSTPVSAWQTRAWADEGQVHWVVDAQAGVPIILSALVQIPSSEKNIAVVASADTSSQTVTNIVHVDLANQGQPPAQVHTPIPAVAYPGPSYVPIPTAKPPTVPYAATVVKITVVAITYTPPTRRSSPTGFAVTGTPKPVPTSVGLTGVPSTIIWRGTFIAPTKVGTVVGVTAAPATIILPTARPPTSAPKTLPPKPTVPPYP